MTSIASAKSFRAALLHMIVGLAAMSAGIISTAGIGALFVRNVFGTPERVILSVGGVFGCAIWGSGLVIGAMLVIGTARFLGEDILAARATRRHTSARRMPPAP